MSQPIERRIIRRLLRVSLRAGWTLGDHQFRSRLRDFARPLLLAVLLANVTSLLPVCAQNVSFKHVVIDSEGPIDPWGKSFGDLNGDGLPDLIVGGSREGGLVWYEAPAWTKHFIRETGRWSTDHETVDVDRDGDLDVVSLTKNSLVWYAAPDFEEHLIEQRVLHDIEVADFDGDGKIDVVGRDQGEFGHSGETLHFYRQGNEQVWQHTQIECPDGEGLAVDDLDGDHDPDVVINSVWYENTRGSDSAFERRSYASNWKHQATFVALHDMNGDGHLDIVVSPSELAGQRYRLSWFESPQTIGGPNRNAGDWKEHVVDQDVEAVHHFVGAGDFDNDGDMDIVAAEMEQGEDPDEVKIYWNAGNSVSWTKQVIAESGSHSMRILDVDQDGDLDLFGANHRGQVVDLWINQLQPIAAWPVTPNQWTHISVDTTREVRAFGLAWGDVDHDGDMDIASGPYLYKNPGGDLSATWERIALPGHIDANYIVDLDGDEYVDIIAQDLPRVVWLEALDPMATSFRSQVITDDLPKTGHGSSQGYAFGNLLGDERPEYALTTGGGIFALEFKSTTNDHVNAELIHVTDQAPEEGLAIGDIDGDRNNDIVAWFGQGSGSRQLAWWKNPGMSENRSWEHRVIGQVAGQEGDRVALGDFNGDGWIDVAATGTTNANDGSAVYWFANPRDESAEWMRAAIGQDLGAMNSLDVADFNGDHRDDVVTGEHRGQERVMLWINKVGDVSAAGQEWTQITIDRGKESHLGTRVADFDGDGDLDVVSIAWDEYPILHLWRNDAK